MTVRLTARGVAEAARKAHEEGRLSAQAPTPVCAYRIEQCGRMFVCAIGAALTDGELEELRNATPHRAGAIGFDFTNLRNLLGWEADDESGVMELQDSHDAWANAAGRAATPAPGASLARLTEEAKAQEADFLAEVARHLEP